MNISIETQILSTFTRRRILGDTKLLIKEPVDNLKVFYYENNILEWFFLIYGLGDDYAGGEYIAKMIFDSDYPKTPPEFYVLTPNGRFTTGRKICLSNSKYHSREWNPLWNIHAILKGFLSIFVEDVDSGISHIKMTPKARQQLAKNSIAWNVNYNKTNNAIYDNLKNNYIGSDNVVNKENEPENKNENKNELGNKNEHDNDELITEESPVFNYEKYENLAKKDKVYRKLFEQFKKDMEHMQ